MLAVRNPYSETFGIGKENLCAVYLSVNLSIYLGVGRQNNEINIAEGGSRKEGYF